ncbi:hypothetical protein HMPREF0880_02918 [Yokenella regensburgei ATCC 43003]|nr:hypothetical protein HMPREF0880_02918 [Yokenella regensburgei ATCC 43003]
MPVRFDFVPKRATSHADDCEWLLCYSTRHFIFTNAGAGAVIPPGARGYPE